MAVLHMEIEASQSNVFQAVTFKVKHLFGKELFVWWFVRTKDYNKKII